MRIASQRQHISPVPLVPARSFLSRKLWTYAPYIFAGIAVAGLALLARATLYERKVTKQENKKPTAEISSPPTMDSTGKTTLPLLFKKRVVHVNENQVYDNIIKKHAEQMEKFESWASDKKWQNFNGSGTGLLSPRNPHYDWWMFPVNYASQGRGKDYVATETVVAHLQSNSSFMKAYRKGVHVVAKSWGWDLATGKKLANATSHQQFDPTEYKYDIRLTKMLYSLLLFKEYDLYNQVRACAINLTDQAKFKYAKQYIIDLTNTSSEELSQLLSYKNPDITVVVQ